MSSTSLPISGLVGSRADLGAMARIEAGRFLRHPAFLIGTALAFGLSIWMLAATDDPHPTDILSMPVMPAFFIGLPSLVAAHRLTRSTDTALEAVATAPGSEGRRTAALALACLVPFAAGAAWTAMLLAMVAQAGVAPQEWWFGTMPDWQVYCLLLALGPVACLGGGLLGVLSGRWLGFPGAAAATTLAIVAVCFVAGGFIEGRPARLSLPWAMFASGTNDDGTQDLGTGNPAFYLLYLLCLCAAAALMAIWHDPASRTRQLRAAVAGVTVIGVACLALAMVTGPQDLLTSDPIPYKIND
jgi:hypothetical protein